MFEKEAEEYAIDNYENCLYDDLPYANDSRAREQSFKDGAEFAYNKAKEDADKMKSRFLELCNLKDMRIAELEKANEWHYVENGDLPKETIPVLILSPDNSVDDCIYIPGEGFKHPVFSNWYNPVAWIEKEKVLPKKEVK